MSGSNFLPTAVVSPVVPVSEPPKNHKSDSSLSSHSKNESFGSRSALNTMRNAGNSFTRTNISLQSLCSTESDCQNSVKRLKLSSCYNNASKFSSLSKCSVELTKCHRYDKELDESSKLNKSDHKNCNKHVNIVTRNENIDGDTESDDEMCLHRWRLQHLEKNKKIKCSKKHQILKPRTTPTTVKISKKHEVSPRKGYKNLPTVCLNQVSDVTSKTQSINSPLYALQLTDLLQRFPSNVTLCSLCHLPSNFLPQLGDLFGPYRPSYNEIFDRYKVLHSQFSRTDVNSSSSADKSQNQICIDQENQTCYVDTACFETEKKIEENVTDLSLQSISGSEKIVKSNAPQFRMLQTVDSILSESNKKPAAKFCRYSKSLHIPGFTGKIIASDKNLPVYTDANKTLLHDINTVVFVEPARTVSVQSNEKSCTTDLDIRSDTTEIKIAHKLDIRPIWTHGPCALWTPGVYCIQNKIYGLTTAVCEAEKSICCYCKRSGATISCKYEKGRAYHFLCCLAQGLTLDESSFMAVR